MKKKSEYYEQEVIAKHYHKYLESCCKELGFEDDADMGYFFYLTASLSISGLRDIGLCVHKAQEILFGSLNKAYKEIESCNENSH